jgi:hypothetical protein
MSIRQLDFYTDQELIEELQLRQDAKELYYLFYLGLNDADDGQSWLTLGNFEYDQLQDLYELEMEEFEENGLYDSDNWTPMSDDEMEEWDDDGEFC